MGRYDSSYTIVDYLKFGIVVLILGGSALKGCASCAGNYDNLDTQKSFNVAVDDSEDAVSITNIVEYCDYSGSQAQFVTQDGLIVLTSTQDTHLLNQYDYNLVKEYAKCLAGGNESIVYSYDELQGLNTSMTEDFFNKKYLDLQYTFNKALIESDECITICEIDSWTDYSDDKIQITLTNGTTILKDIKDIKLLNAQYAEPDSVYNYTLSLVGDESKIQYYSSGKILVK